MRNEPNSRRSAKAPAADCAKQSQLSRRCPVGRGHRGRGRGANVQNEPNFPGGAGRDGAAAAWSVGRMCKTKPICPAQRNRWGKPHPTRGHNGAKQTQFSPGGKQAGSLRSEQCKTNPISGGRPRPQQRIVQNKANLPGRARWDRVWQTRIVEGNRAKRTQSGTSFKFEVSSVKLEKSMADSSYFKLHTSSSAEGRSCETNPIPRGRAQAMDVECATICRPHPELPSLSENGLCFPPACVEWLDSQLTRHR